MLCVLCAAAAGRDAGGRVSGAEDAAAAGAGAAQCVPEQNQDAHRHPAREGGERPGAESVHPQSPAGTKGKS